MNAAHEQRPGPRERALLWAILSAGLLLRLWNYRLGGFGSDYYSAAVRSMGESLHNFFFDSFDPAGFITIDKPPLALWVQALSARICGFSGFAILLPQALEGTAAIAAVHALVARGFGRRAALLAAAILAINPVSVAVDRSSNLESALTLALVAAVYCFERAVATGRARYFLGAMALVGAAFNIKFLAGWLIAPVLFAVYFFRSPAPPRARLIHCAGALAVLLAVSLAWVSAFDAQTPANRPYVAKTEHNSMLELAFGTYGLALISGEGSPANPLPSADPARPRSVFFDDVAPGLARLWDRHLAGQTAWFLPFVVVGLALMLGVPGLSIGARWSLAVWAGWAALYGTAFAYDRGTFHGYYLAAIGPPMAVLAAVGIDRVCRELRGRERWLLASWLALAAWQIYIEWEAAGHFPWIVVTIAVGAALAALAGLAGGRSRIVGSALGLAALAIAPMAWALSSVIVPRVNTLTPSADILRLAGVIRNPLELASSGYGVATDDPKLWAFLQAHSHGEAFLLATPNARLAAPIIIHTGQAVLAMGGFSGEDRAVSPDELRSMADAHRVRYVFLGDDLAFGTHPEDAARAQQFLSLATRTGRKVDRALWRTPREPLEELLRSGRALRLQGARMQLYDLRPVVEGPASPSLR
jgi:4-amino-4-deoxy-L-arabinose transferase-like glycosyltransferase